MQERRKLSTILFADIAGYTSLMGSDERYALSLLNQFKVILEQFVPAHQGEIVQYFGDACLLSFDSAQAGVECAIDLQTAFIKAEIPIRIGMHLGDVVYKENNVFGDGVNIASRIESIGQPGAILFSKAIYAQIKNKRKFTVSYCGYFEFKNVEQPTQVYALANEGFVVPDRADLQGKLKNKKNKISKSWKLAILGLVAAGLLSTVLFFYNSKKSNAEKSIAVLAFSDMSPDQDQEFFSDGISEELLNLISQTPDLRVISRTSSFSFKGKDLTAEEIGKELKVSHLLEGSVRRADNTLRITAQLINMADGAHSWSANYDRDMDNILKIQDEIASEVTRKLQVSLGYLPQEKPVNPEAYILYLEARYLTHQNTKDAYLKAENIIKQSLAIDSLYAPAHSLLSHIYKSGSYNFMTMPVQEAISKGIASAQKALSLDPDNAQAHVNLGSIYMSDWRFAEGDKYLRRALELNPNNASIIGTLALNMFGHTNQAIALIEKAIAIDPILYINYYNLGYHLYNAGQLDRADAALDTFVTYIPDSPIYHYLRSSILLARGQDEEALVEAEKETHDFFNLYARNFALFSLGRTEEADVLLKELVDTYGGTEATNMADIYAFRGEIDTAFDWLNKAVAIKDPVLLEGLNFPSFKILHQDPRWQDLIEMMGLPEDHGYAMELPAFRN